MQKYSFTYTAAIASLLASLTFLSEADALNLVNAVEVGPYKSATGGSQNLACTVAGAMIEYSVSEPTEPPSPSVSNNSIFAFGGI